MKKIDADMGPTLASIVFEFWCAVGKGSPLAEWRPIVVNRYRYRESVGIGDVSECAVCLGLLCSAIILIGGVGLLVSAIEPLIWLVRPEVEFFAFFPHRNELMFGQTLEMLLLFGCRRRFHLEPGLDKGRLDLGFCDFACLRCARRNKRDYRDDRDDADHPFELFLHWLFILVSCPIRLVASCLPSDISPAKTETALSPLSAFPHKVN